MNPESYIKALLEELRSPRDKSAEAKVRTELARLNVSAPSAKAIKAETAQAQAPEVSKPAEA